MQNNDLQVRTFAALTGIRQDEAFGADAPEAALGVLTPAVGTDPGDTVALVLVDALVSVRAQDKAVVTAAQVGPLHVPTHAVSAQATSLLAFVDICTKTEKRHLRGDKSAYQRRGRPAS